jgi:hypothetical protein
LDLLNSFCGRDELTKEALVMDCVEQLEKYWDARARDLLLHGSLPPVGYLFESLLPKDFDELNDAFCADFDEIALDSESDDTPLENSIMLTKKRRFLHGFDTFVEEVILLTTF